MSFPLTIENLILLCETEEELLAYLQFKKLILNEKKCSKCKRKCYIYRIYDKFTFKCPKCRKYYETAPKPFFLNKIKIKYITFFQILIYFLANIPIVTVSNLVNISRTILIDYYKFFREVCCNEIFNWKEKIGGANKIVEIDESLVGRREYNKGRIVEGRWVIGGIERDSGKCFLVPVVNRNSQTLKEILKEYIEPGTTVITNEWKGYRELEEIDLNYLKEKHSINFVDPQTSAHTNTIESEWGKMKNKLRTGRYEKHFISYFGTYIWKKEKGEKDIVENFIEAIVRQQVIEETREGCSKKQNVKKRKRVDRGENSILQEGESSQGRNPLRRPDGALSGEQMSSQSFISEFDLFGESVSKRLNNMSRNDAVQLRRRIEELVTNFRLQMSFSTPSNPLEMPSDREETFVDVKVEIKEEVIE